MERPTYNSQRSSGLALVLVLWVLVLLTIMAGSFSLTMKRELSVISNLKDLAQTSALSEAGINYAMLMLLHTDKEQQWQSDGSLYEFQFAGAQIRVSIVNESGKIDINKVNEDLLRGALTDAGASEEQQDMIIDSILDWTDKNDLVRLSGAEKDDYDDAGLSYEPSNKAFQVVDELQLILGMQTDLFNKIKPLVTVYSGQNSINATKAPREVLLALPDTTEQSVDDYFTLKAEHAKNGLPAPDFPWATSSSGNTSNVYTVRAEAMLPNGSTGATQAVIRKSAGGRNGLPFTILEWDSAHVSQGSFFMQTNDALVIN